MKKIALTGLLILGLISCENEKNKTIPQENKPLSVKSKETITNEETVFPKTGKKASDFVPKSGEYEIQYEESGDLNNDKLKDITIVLRNIDDNTAERPVLILLQNNDQTYSLAKLSTVAFPSEYLNDDIKTYNTESIEIQNGILIINLYGSGGMVGNLFSHYKFIDNDLELVYIETYNAGAGSWQNLYFDLEKGKLIEVITNTMTEDMATEDKTFDIKLEKQLFEKASPDEVINNVLKSVDSNY